MERSQGRTLLQPVRLKPDTTSTGSAEAGLLQPVRLKPDYFNGCGRSRTLLQRAGRRSTGWYPGIDGRITELSGQFLGPAGEPATRPPDRLQLRECALLSSPSPSLLALSSSSRGRL